MSYNGRDVMAKVAVQHDVHIIEDIWPDREDGVTFVAYVGRGKVLAVIGWDENNCAPYIEAFPASDEARVIRGAGGLIAIRRIIEGKDN